MTEEELKMIEGRFRRPCEWNVAYISVFGLALIAEVRQLQGKAARLEADVERLQAELAKWVPQVRAGWKLGCPNCPWCGKPCRPKAHLLGDDGWLLWFECDNCGHEDDMPIDWPFESGVLATAADFEALGFEVEP